MRGVHLERSNKHGRNVGSSPHARGPHRVFGLYGVAVRIIPACAGSTGDCWDPGLVREDHPRMRGVHPNVLEKLCNTQGSSPHARGPPADFHARYLCTGIIPACAGSTVDNDFYHGSRRDHPRMRGVHPMPMPVPLACQGSSPHARGPLGSCPAPRFFYRIIPACAGSTT